MRRSLPVLSLLLLTLATTAGAQRRSDQARLSFGIGMGYNGQSNMWRIDGQPLNDNAFHTDTVTVSRNIRSTIGLAFVGVYYPNDHWGFTGEAHLIGLGYADGCVMRTVSVSAQNQAVCTTLQGQESPGTTVAATVGGVYRPFQWADFQPYVRLNAGLLLSQQSAIRMRATIIKDTTGALVDYYVYEDKHPASISPTVAIGGGMTAFVSRAYQLRFEVKDNIVSLEHVTGTVPLSFETPPSVRKIHHILSLTIGLEVVLERKRGRRY
jgi:hypothetical protein